jgi:hypothetical protein
MGRERLRADLQRRFLHSLPFRAAIGGTGTKFVTLRREVNGEYDPLIYLGGSFQNQAIHPTSGGAEGGNTAALRRTTPLFDLD